MSLQTQEISKEVRTSYKIKKRMKNEMEILLPNPEHL